MDTDLAITMIIIAAAVLHVANKYLGLNRKSKPEIVQIKRRKPS